MQTVVARLTRVAVAPRWLALAAGIALACAGCQSAAPGGLPGAFAARDEKQIVKLAKRDPFPSPADVGLTQPTAVP